MLLAVLALSLAPVVKAEPVPVGIVYVEIDGDKYEEETTVADVFRRGDTLDIEVKLLPEQDAQDVQVEAYISGYRYGDRERDLVSQVTPAFDMEAGQQEKVSFSLTIPTDIEQDFAKLRIRVSDRNSDSFEQTYQLVLRGTERDAAVSIEDFFILPSSRIEAGRTVDFLVKLENIGNEDLEDLTIIVEVPGLGLAEAQVLAELDEDESKTVEEFGIWVPRCADPGTYDVTLTVDYDKYEQESVTRQLTVLASDTCSAQPTVPPQGGRTLIQVTSTQSVFMGDAGAVYPIIITNNEAMQKTYTLRVLGLEAWGVSSFDPANVLIVGPGESKTVFLQVNANDDAEAGETYFQLEVSDGVDTVSKSLLANIVDDAGANGVDLKKGLEITLIVLVIILIILGLVIGFNKMKGDDGEEEDESYY